MSPRSRTSAALPTSRGQKCTSAFDEPEKQDSAVSSYEPRGDNNLLAQYCTMLSGGVSCVPGVGAAYVPRIGRAGRSPLPSGRQQRHWHVQLGSRRWACRCVVGFCAKFWHMDNTAYVGSQICNFEVLFLGGILEKKNRCFWLV